MGETKAALVHVSLLGGPLVQGVVVRCRLGTRGERKRQSAYAAGCADSIHLLPALARLGLRLLPPLAILHPLQQAPKQAHFGWGRGGRLAAIAVSRAGSGAHCRSAQAGRCGAVADAAAGCVLRGDATLAASLAVLLGAAV